MDSHAEHQHHSTKAYFVVYTILMALLVVTVAMAYVHFGALNIPLAFLVASIKAGLVIWFFMHARDSSPMVLACIMGTLLMLAIGIVLLLMDYLTR